MVLLKTEKRFLPEAIKPLADSQAKKLGQIKNVTRVTPVTIKKQGEIMNDQELMKKIDEVSEAFHGQIDDLQAAVGLVMVGRVYGWRVIRLASSRRHWMVACKLFGDLKEILPERTAFSDKSLALRVVDKAGDYWDFVAGNVSRDTLPLHERKMLN